jgi:uncharacterized surface protein with fasciclin (FAS1) repeats
MNKLNFIRMSPIAYVVVCIMVISSALFASSWNRQQSSSTIGDNEMSPSAPNKPPIPNNMMPTKGLMETESNTTKNTSALTLVEILLNDPSFSHLTKAINSTELADTLEGPGPFTLFAPDDKAFAKLSPNTLADLMNPMNKDTLTAILTYHVIPGKITPDKFKTMKIRTLQGKPLNVNVAGDNKTVNNAKVISDEKVGSNGIIYVIDTVLIP